MGDSQKYRREIREHYFKEMNNTPRTSTLYKDIEKRVMGEDVDNRRTVERSTGQRSKGQRSEGRTYKTDKVTGSDGLSVSEASTPSLLLLQPQLPRTHLCTSQYCSIYMQQPCSHQCSNQCKFCSCLQPSSVHVCQVSPAPMCVNHPKPPNQMPTHHDPPETGRLERTQKNLSIPVQGSHYEQQRQEQLFKQRVHQNPLHLPSKPYEKLDRREGAGGDQPHYKNDGFRSSNSNEPSCNGSAQLSKKTDGKFVREEERSMLNFLESAREHRKAINTKFNQLFPLPNGADIDGASTRYVNNTNDSVNSAMSGSTPNELRKFLNVETSLEDAIDESIKHLNDMKEKAIARSPKKTERLNLMSLITELIDTPRSVSKELSMGSQSRSIPLSVISMPLKTTRSTRDVNVKSAEELKRSMGAFESLPIDNVNSAPPQLDYSVSADDIVFSKVITPVILKLHHMYLHNLREEMSVMDDLQSMPLLIRQVYKTMAEQQDQK